MVVKKASTDKFSLFPDRMTKKWLQRRTDEELVLLAKEYDSYTCRGNDIRTEMNQRKKARGVL